MSKHKINFQVLQAPISLEDLLLEAVKALVSALLLYLSDFALFDSDGEGSGRCLTWVADVQ